MEICQTPRLSVTCWRGLEELWATRYRPLGRYLLHPAVWVSNVLPGKEKVTSAVWVPTVLPGKFTSRSVGTNCASGLGEGYIPQCGYQLCFRGRRRSASRNLTSYLVHRCPCWISQPFKQKGQTQASDKYLQGRTGPKCSLIFVGSIMFLAA